MGDPNMRRSQNELRHEPVGFASSTPAARQHGGRGKPLPVQTAGLRESEELLRRRLLSS